jgi:hypothetical protein
LAVTELKRKRSRKTIFIGYGRRYDIYYQYIIVSIFFYLLFWKFHRCTGSDCDYSGHAKLAEQLMKRMYSSPEEAARDHRGDFTLAVHLAGSVECLKLVLPLSDINAVRYLSFYRFNANIILTIVCMKYYIWNTVTSSSYFEAFGCGGVLGGSRARS